MKHTTSLAAAAAFLLAGSPAMATDIGHGLDLSFNTTLTSDYIWRGMSQSQNGTAIQGGVDLKHASGAYVGLWSSSTEFEYAPDVNAEVDMYAGYGFSVGDAAIDLRYTQFWYPGESGFNFSEYHVGASYVGFTLSLDYSNDLKMADPGLGDLSANLGIDPPLTNTRYNTTFHKSLAYTASLPYEVSATATVGNYDFKDAWVGSENDYNYYMLAFTKEMYGINWGVTLSNTDVDNDDCVTFAGEEGYCDSMVSFSATKYF